MKTEQTTGKPVDSSVSNISTEYDDPYLDENYLKGDPSGEIIFKILLVIVSVLLLLFYNA